ncbi:transporter substrate-binding domain-containing protein [Pseudomonas fluorescens]|uniref:transporter substrate-binding domain-containing protein n=1 Tax=Pseudomonas fluorescens TaxID=294 RepID=UPI00177C3E78|nr:transporter substrate-binding domain-containing protein [Pseudomonas fluorescens]
MLTRVLLLALLCGLVPAPGQAAPTLHSRATLDSPRPEPDGAELRWLWERRQLRLGVIERDNPPFDILGTGQLFEGLTADYAGLIADQLHLQVEVHAYASFAEAVAALREGEIDLLGSVSAQQALEAGLHLSRAYAEDRPLLIAQEEGGTLIGREDEFRLAMVEGYRSYEQLRELFPLARLQLHPSRFSALAAVSLGHADVFLGNALGSRYVLGRSQLAAVEEIGDAALPSQGIGFAMLEDGGPLPRLVDAALASLSERQQARISERWSPMAGTGHKPEPLQFSAVEQRWLRDNPTVTVLVDEQLLPLSFRDGKGQLRGLSLDVLQLIARRTGLQFEVRAGGSVERMIAQLHQGKAQVIAGLPHSPLREQQLVFSRAYLSASRVLVSRDEVQAPTSLEQLQGRKLALVNGSALAELVRQRYPQIRQLPVAGPVAALKAVARGEAAATVLSLDAARPLIARWYPGRLQVSASLALPPAHFALASNRGATELQSILNKALLSLTPRETDVLMRRWRNPLIVADGDWQRYRQRILLGFAVVLALLLLASLWIRYLRRLQVELRRTKAEADAANQAKTQFLTTMSHEIRTPLHAVLGMLELAQRKAEQGVLDRLAIEVAADAAGGLLELIGDVLDITRIEAGQLQLTPQRVRLREQVARVVQLFEQQARSKGLALRLEADGAVDAEVMLDPVRFKQVLANLLSNAIKFTPQGHVRVSLHAQAVGERLAVELQVEDTGIGIAEAELAGLGQPFRQASNQRQSPRCSTGLGLGISRSLCEMMGGRMALHSVLGQGTRVEILLDLARPPAGHQGQALPAVQVATAGVRLRVLVVDDYPPNRLLLAQQLEYLGHQARVAKDGAQALRLWLKEHIDVVISDCNMPRLNGHALARAIRLHERRNRRPACRLIGLTANALESERQRCLAVGMDDCLFKPLGLDELVRALALYQPETTSQEAMQRLDLRHLLRLVGNDQAAFKALLADLRSSNQQDLRRLEALVNDPPALAQLAHRIKGGARIARAEGVIRACQQVELTCKSRPLQAAHLRRDVQALRVALQRLETQLAERIATDPPDSYHP